MFICVSHAIRTLVMEGSSSLDKRNKRCVERKKKEVQPSPNNPDYLNSVRLFSVRLMGGSLYYRRCCSQPWLPSSLPVIFYQHAILFGSNGEM